MSWSRQVYILYRDFYRDLFRLFSGLKLWSRNPQKSADFGWPDKPRIRTMAVFGTAMRRFESCRPSQVFPNILSKLAFRTTPEPWWGCCQTKANCSPRDALWIARVGDQLMRECHSAKAAERLSL